MRLTTNLMEIIQGRATVTKVETSLILEFTLDTYSYTGQSINLTASLVIMIQLANVVCRSILFRWVIIFFSPIYKCKN